MSQARLSQHLAARLVQQCPKQLPSAALQKAAQLILASGADNAAPFEDEVSQLCGAEVAADAPAPALAEEPNALEAVSQAKCNVQVSNACRLNLHCVAISNTGMLRGTCPIPRWQTAVADAQEYPCRRACAPML